MSSSVNLEDFRIPLQELKRATNDFRRYGTNTWCEGKLSERWQNRKAFVKRYIKKGYESHELEIVSRLHHENITSFIGWADRLEICIRVANVLNYLHSGFGEHCRVIHGDVKCHNILVNSKLIKVSGFEYSKLVPLNQPHQHHHCPEKLFQKYHTDPIYKETNLLSTGSDVYSFGVLMFEILHGSGTSIFHRDDEHLLRLINMARGCYDGGGPYKLVDPKLKGEFDHRSLHTFTTIAYKCISFDIKERPEMDEIVKTIEKALDIHFIHRLVHLILVHEGKNTNPSEYVHHWYRSEEMKTAIALQ
ncbi:protein kinase, ATP binding site-containing protein [Tanacetum coccineum]